MSFDDATETWISDTTGDPFPYVDAWNAVIPGEDFSLNGIWWLLVCTHAFIVLQKLFQAHHDEHNYVKAQVTSTFALILQVISLLEVMRTLTLFNGGFFDAA